MRKNRKKSAPGEKTYVKLWNAKRDSKAVMTGYVQLGNEFLQELIRMLEDGEIEFTEYDNLQLGIALFEADDDSRNSPELTGQVYLPEPEEKPKSRTKSKRRKDNDDDDDDDEPVSHRRRNYQL